MIMATTGNHRRMTMPMPKPDAGESSEEWMDRCMANPTMNSEYPENDQRAATCHQTWRDAHSARSSVEISPPALKRTRVKLIPAGYVTTSKGDFVFDEQAWQLVSMKLDRRKGKMGSDY